MPTNDPQIICLRLFAIVGVIALVHDVAFLFYFGRYPPGYMYNNFNLYMDFFNTAYFNYFGSPYAEWESIYLPLVFAVQRMLEPLIDTSSWGLLFAKNQTEVETQSWIFRHTLLQGNLFVVPVIALICAAITVGIAGKQKSKGWCILFFLIILTSKPFLFAMERGNLIILSMPLMALFMACKKEVYRQVCLAFLVSTKIYFALLLIAIRPMRSVREFMLIGLTITSLVLVINLLSNHFYDLDFDLKDFVISISNFSSVTKPPVEEFGFNYSALLLPKVIIRWLAIHVELGLWLEVCLQIVFYMPLSVLFVFVVRTVSRSTVFLDRVVLSTLMLATFVPQSGGYIGLCLLLLVPRIISYGDRHVSLALLFVLMSVDFGLTSNITGPSWSLALSEDQIGTALYGAMTILRPLFTLIILARLSQSISNSQSIIEKLGQTNMSTRRL